MRTFTKIAALMGFLLLAISAQALTVAPADSTQADTTYWTKSFALGINFNQAAFSDNWKGGGVSSVALGTLLNFRAGYLKGKISWDTELDLQYGILKNAGQNLRKNADRILMDTKVGYRISSKWNMYFSGNYLSQFAPGYRYAKDAAGLEQELIISRFMSPAFITGSLGFEYKPADYFWLRLSPTTSRITIVNDTTIYRNVPENYGVPIGQTTRYEWMAFQVMADLNKNLAENINLKLRYLAFGNYETLAFKTIDHRVETIITAKVSRYINTNLTAILLYDSDQDKGVQLSQVLALGFLFKL